MFKSIVVSGEEETVLGTLPTLGEAKDVIESVIEDEQFDNYPRFGDSATYHIELPDGSLLFSLEEGDWQEMEVVQG